MKPVALQRAPVSKRSSWKERLDVEEWVEKVMAPYRAKRCAMPAALKIQILEYRRDARHVESFFKLL